MLSRRTSKHRNIPVIIDGVRFDSKGEAARFQQLKLIELSGQISRLELKPKYEFMHNGQKFQTYTPDFQYFDETTKKTIVEDYKGHMKSEDRRIKKMMKIFFSVDILYSGPASRVSVKKNGS